MSGTPHHIHAFVVTQVLAHIDYVDDAIGTVSQEIETHLAPFAAIVARLDEIPGINQRTAEVLIAELGVDLRVFPTDRHLSSWAGLCPGQNESAGKHKAATMRKGHPWVRAALVEVA